MELQPDPDYLLTVDDFEAWEDQNTPGVSAEAVRYLTASSIIAPGVETVGTDAGQAFALEPPRPRHSTDARSDSRDEGGR
ncbi:hypothetical protein JCM18899A_48700 [Nocardioides sp. AN3]